MTVSSDISESKQVPSGMYVTQIQANSPAMAAGIQSGDVIQSVDGEEIALWLSMKRYFRSVKREIRSGFRENVSVQEDTWRFRFSWYLTAVSKE